VGSRLIFTPLSGVGRVQEGSPGTFGLWKTSGRQLPVGPIGRAVDWLAFILIILMGYPQKPIFIVDLYLNLCQNPDKYGWSPRVIQRPEGESPKGSFWRKEMVMGKILRTFLAVGLLLIPVSAWADASVVQEWCEQYIEGNNDPILVNFAVVNFSLPAPLCDLHLIPEPQPVLPDCEILSCVAPPGWTCVLNAMGGADFFANTPNDCIQPGTRLTGFGLVVSIPEWCCYIAQFTGPDGGIMLEQEECFSCSLVPNEEKTWGSIKSMYN
jgi:hypothetical protein